MKRLLFLALVTAGCSSGFDHPTDGGIATDGASVPDAGAGGADAANDTSSATDASSGDVGVPDADAGTTCVAPTITSCTAGTPVMLATGGLVDAMFWNGGYVLSDTTRIARVSTSGTVITPWTTVPFSSSPFTQANGIQLGANAMGIVAATRTSQFGVNGMDAETMVVDGAIQSVAGPFTIASSASYVAITRDATGFAWGNSLAYFTPLQSNAAPATTGAYFSNPSSYPIVAVASGPNNFLTGEWFAYDACEFVGTFDSSGTYQNVITTDLIPADQEPNCALTAGLSVAHAQGHYLVSYARFLTAGRLGFTVYDDKNFTATAWNTSQPGAYGSNVASDGCLFGIAWTVNTSPNGVTLQASFQLVDASGNPLAPIVSLGGATTGEAVIAVPTPTGFVVVWHPTSSTSIVATPITCQ